VLVAWLLPGTSLRLTVLFHVGLFAAYLAVLWRLPILARAEREAARQLCRHLVTSIGVRRSALPAPSEGTS
jgi:hypothetical protein